MIKLLISIIFMMIAGLSSIIGNFINFSGKSYKKIGPLLSLTTGIMICVCIKGLLPEAEKLLSSVYYYPKSTITLILSLVIGFILSIILDKLITQHDSEKHNSKKDITSILMLILHTLPESIAIIITTYNNYLTAILLTIAIAIHHIPGCMNISQSYNDNNYKKKILTRTIANGLILPGIGLLVIILLKPILNNLGQGILLAIVSPIMLYIALKEFIPSSLKYSNKKALTLFAMLGIIFTYLLELI